MDSAWQHVDDALDRIRREVDVQREKSNQMCKLRTAHNWVDYKTSASRVHDDETMTFFWREKDSALFYTDRDGVVLPTWEVEEYLDEVVSPALQGLDVATVEEPRV